MFELLAINWHVNPEIFSIGALSIRWYSLLFISGFILGWFIFRGFFRREGVPESLLDPLLYTLLIGTIVGARLGHCLFYEPAYYLGHFWEMILPIKEINGSWKFIGYSGLASHGGVIGVVTGLLLYIRKTKLPFMWVLDSLGIAAPIFSAMVRLGNLMNSEIIGLPTEMPWGFVFVKTGITEPCHPAQLYESLAYFAVFIAIIILYHKHKEKVGTGLYAGFTLFTIFTFRFFVEFCKEVQVDFEEGMALDMGQILSIPFMLIGAYFIYRGIKLKIKAKK